MSSNPKSETGLLQVRLVVASIGAVIIGFLSATMPETYGRKTPPEVTGNAVPTPRLPASSNLKSVARLVPDPILGFAVIAVAPAALDTSCKVTGNSGQNSERHSGPLSEIGRNVCDTLQFKCGFDIDCPDTKTDRIS